MKKTSWYMVAPLMEEFFGVQYDEEDGFYRCPECDEPIYQEDYPTLKLAEDNLSVLCPVCGCAHEVF